MMSRIIMLYNFKDTIPSPPPTETIPPIETIPVPQDLTDIDNPIPEIGCQETPDS